MTTKVSEPKFGRIREFFWPIMGYELKKFLPMALMQFFIIFVYTVLRNTKDALVVAAGGAAVIPFLKGYIVLPASILFVVFYGKLVDKLSKKAVFFTVVGIFFAFFALFGFIFYPFQDFFHPSHERVAALKASMPMFTHFFSIFETWSYSIFYVMSELWGSVMNALLFWQFANEITKTQEAKRFYAMFLLIANISLLFSGAAVKVFSVSSTTVMVQMVCATVLLSCLCVTYIYNWIHKNVLTDSRFFTPKDPQQKSTKKKVKLGVLDSFAVLFSSKYLLMITVLVFAYGSSINLIELLWKNQMKLQFPNPNDYLAFMGNLSIGTGIGTILVIMFSKGIVSRFGWFWGAIVTPLTILVTGLLFFACVFFTKIMDPVMSFLGVTSLLASVWIGTIQNILSKSAKYSLFDPTKEMAYIPLDEESRTKGKAAVDVVGGRFGKAGGGYIASVLMMAAPMIGIDSSVEGIAPILTIFIMVIVVSWIYAVFTLDRLYRARLASNAKSEK